MPEVMDAKDITPWCLEKVLKRENIILSRVGDAPAATRCDLVLWQYYGIKSVLIFPLFMGDGPVFGALSFSTNRDERDWTLEIVNRLQLVAGIFANALARKMAKKAGIKPAK